jgi:hypothetical protein
MVGIGIGAAVGAAGSAITGGDPLMGAVLGGLSGGYAGYTGGLGFGTDSIFSTIGGELGFSTSTSLFPAIGSGITQAGAAGLAVTGLGSSVLIGKLTPGTPEYSNAYQQQQQQYNSRPSTVTGSGGKQAAFSLAESVRRAKKRKLTQEDVSELSIDTSSFASEGLQFA